FPVFTAHCPLSTANCSLPPLPTTRANGIIAASDLFVLASGESLMWIAEEPSAALKEALQLLAQGKSGEAEMVVKKAAMNAKAKHGSGSHPLAKPYGDIGPWHLRMGEFGKAAVEFQHACKSTLPPDVPSRRDRLGFMYGFAE